MRVLLISLLISFFFLFGCKKQTNVNQGEKLQVGVENLRDAYLDSLKKHLAVLKSQISELENKGERPQLIKESNLIHDSVSVAFANAERIRLINKRSEINMKIVEFDRASGVLPLRKQSADLQTIIEEYQE